MTTVTFISRPWFYFEGRSCGLLVFLWLHDCSVQTRPVASEQRCGEVAELLLLLLKAAGRYKICTQDGAQRYWSQRKPR
ncbi:hypothetical protein CHARACLAT_009940 [Characodon lateralis]|uniref:Secreted protein n=1 Tax=Characodon lateralis TaxID=208331 RepID=A0ABU7EI18_9TELE|nr:hypothetical protein [Characodon lateralis]